ncbi:hypothetical protein [Modestobacter sp. DSM 44400]|uniref:hypothetical protein n=1 Tax=Modestobacter sp. DSM 44400 TaxID=1550230 RepID=UPI0020C8DE3D|nr:hypothetical protein [Modestobacter sp. DSM 44400]
MISVLATAAAPALARGLVLLDPAVPGPRPTLDPLVALTFTAYALPGVRMSRVPWNFGSGPLIN